MMIVKPALSYLDIIRDVRNNSNVPIIAYNVSGEYSMTKAAALNGWIDEEKSCDGANDFYETRRSRYDHHLLCERHLSIFRSTIIGGGNIAL